MSTKTKDLSYNGCKNVLNRVAYKLVKQNNSFRTVSIDEKGEDCLQTVFRNGELLIDDNFADIKSRALKYSNYL